jgi:hypothetical protein
VEVAFLGIDEKRIGDDAVAIGAELLPLRP